MSRNLLVSACITAALGLGLGASAAAKEGSATAPEATALVKKGVAFLKANGKEKGYAEFSNKAGAFVDRDLYLTVYGLDGTVRAHGANEKMIGKNLIDLKDVDGKAFGTELWTTGNKAGGGTVEYKWENPVTKKVEPKVSVERKVGQDVCGVGAYK
jgi:cytochrome c